MSADFGQTRSTPGRVGPTSGHIRSKSRQFGPTSAKFGQTRTSFGRNRPTLVESLRRRFRLFLSSRFVGLGSTRDRPGSIRGRSRMDVASLQVDRHREPLLKARQVKRHLHSRQLLELTGLLVLDALAGTKDHAAHRRRGAVEVHGSMKSRSRSPRLGTLKERMGVDLRSLQDGSKAELGASGVDPTSPPGRAHVAPAPMWDRSGQSIGIMGPNA